MARWDKHPDLGKKTPEELIKSLDSVPDDVRTVVRNNGGGHVNHTMFWQIMKPGGGGEPTGKIEAQIIADFGLVRGLQEALQRNHSEAVWRGLGMAGVEGWQARHCDHAEPGQSDVDGVCTRSWATTCGNTRTT